MKSKKKRSTRKKKKKSNLQGSFATSLFIIGHMDAYTLKLGMAVEFRAPEKTGAVLVKENISALSNPSSFC
jgi:hypothetical protein